MTAARPQRVLITGANSGIGKATALAFANAGIDLALFGRSHEKLSAAVANVTDRVDVRTYVLDLARVEVVADTVAAAIADCGGIDVLVNNAGIGYTNAIADTPLSEWRYVLDLNLTSVFQCIQGALPVLRKRGGTIINIASIAARSPFPTWGAYSASKAGLVALSRALAAEERDRGVRVVTICPGAVNTPLWDTDTVAADLNRAAMLPPDSVAQFILQAALLSPQAVVEDLTLMPNAGAL
ncbi:short-chain dehydrogenase [Rubidibacter lacunae KORDI 51-2]|uniref:Short-chain dehydrogenase n=1 Tax=Rubidibacter lacunae KORDI 51-2 TaxID=582515 RepID=U5DHC7_9CHRO|nr:SDR family oxidoreductase [Rubidibacter lacunae]ERN39974.1 short-chain dehydrogenase [Rubidibacter lacunae KORDI 51-2]